MLRGVTQMKLLSCGIHELVSNCSKTVAVMGQQLEIVAVQLTHWSVVDDNVSFAFVLQSDINMDALYGVRFVEHALQHALVALLAEHNYAATSAALQNAKLEFAEQEQQEYTKAIVMDCYCNKVYAAMSSDCVHAHYKLLHCTTA
jgi:hypothetical protein